MTLCPEAFTAWKERNSRDDLARKAIMKAREVEGKGMLVGQDVPKLQAIFLQIAIIEAVGSFP
jgi:hypothetical protein